MELNVNPAAARHAQAQPAAPSISAAMALLFAVACGLAVANVYYAQPLLDTLAATFGIRPATVGIVITITQVGYGLGLLMVVPLGDLVDRRRLIVGQSLLSVDRPALRGARAQRGDPVAGDGGRRRAGRRDAGAGRLCRAHGAAGGARPGGGHRDDRHRRGHPAGARGVGHAVGSLRLALGVPGVRRGHAGRRRPAVEGASPAGEGLRCASPTCS
jgi:hypothetical protein